MKKVIRLTESDLQRLIKRVIKETEQQATDVEQITPDELIDLDTEKQRVDAALEPTKFGSPTDLVDVAEEDKDSEIDQLFQEQIAKKGLTQVYQKNKDFIDQQISDIKSVEGKYDLCKRSGRKQAKNELKNKLLQILSKIKNKEKTVNEQIGAGILLAVGWLLVGFLLMFWRRIFIGDGCRKWSRWKQTRMSGYR